MNRAARFATLAAWAATALAGALPQRAEALGQAPITAEASSSYVLPVRTIKELRHERAFRTTLHQKFDFSCGSAALATLLTYQYGRPVDEATVFQAMYAAGDQAKIRVEGFSLLDMKRYLDAHGYRSDGVRVSLDELSAARVPAIALISDNGYRHFVVVKGREGERVVLGDPALGTRIVTRAQFESLWQGGIFFVIRDHRELARFNDPADWHARLLAPLATGIEREGPGAFSLGIPGPERF